MIDKAGEKRTWEMRAGKSMSSKTPILFKVALAALIFATSVFIYLK